jgi:hypothetical protein
MLKNRTTVSVDFVGNYSGPFPEGKILIVDITSPRLNRIIC